MANVSKIKIDNTEYVLKDSAGLTSLPIATTSQYGAIKPDGETIQVNANGTISVVGYDLPYATQNQKGGIRISYAPASGTLSIMNQDS